MGKVLECYDDMLDDPWESDGVREECEREHAIGCDPEVNCECER